MSELPDILPIDGPTYRPRSPDPLDFIVTPASFAYELHALRGGWSRNVWPRLDGRGFELVLWSRHFHDTPPLTARYDRDEVKRIEVLRIEGGDGGPVDRHDAAALGRYRWDYDPMRYAVRQAPRARGMARLREMIEDRRTTRVPIVPFPAGRLPIVIRRWSASAEGGPLDGPDAV